ncbi:hypothetical protein GGTG_08337 [Gaeumannomyces tritici R3-111a-1]|uniref:Uncharacterized protein n=1 Tax=Gaeumannomyces tritici (strain R3-111a-1) TaxID=644352 RepID=J3P4A1_GAET3|nr:hypothetical protein GGTG_08337 [Gaeumannomyces tritici R3-111a-1]EJT74497.1 hypothetical protein GGTG_08337 [Gaeumannomyces tritici R3-111a-1]
MTPLRSEAAASLTRQAPPITQVDLVAFHRRHFSGHAMDHFSSHFMPPCQQATTQDETEEDGLGHYADGVKRTLTDEQIEMFQHSELEALRKKNTYFPAGSCLQEGAPTTSGDAADADTEGDIDLAVAPRKKKKRGKGRNRKPEVKVDLRKRTWDVVDTSLHSLDYGDQEQPSVPATATTKRRHISYDDG